MSTLGQSKRKSDPTGAKTPSDRSPRLSRRKLQRLHALLERWSQVWQVDGLADRVRIDLSDRLTRTWARAQPRRCRIALHPAIVAGSSRRLERVLCHEAAHIAAFELHGADIRAHGPEWQQLVRTAGFRPELRLASRAITVEPTQAVDRFQHRCPVCQMTRIARRPVKAWRCAECVEAGLDGRLEITRIQGAAQ